MVSFVCLVLLGGVEPWADPKLPSSNGLVFWLDATTIDAAAQAKKSSRPKSDSEVERWYDGSGHQRDVVQKDAKARPKYLEVGTGRVVRFDGTDDALRSATAKKTLEGFHVFLFVAPHTNPGYFRGFLAANAPNGRDYQTGFNIDMSSMPSSDFSFINVEAKGAGGQHIFSFQPRPTSTPTSIEVVANPKEKRLRVFADGKPAGERLFEGKPISFEELTVGARFFNNGNGPQQVDCWAATDIAELLVYDRPLDADQAAEVRKYLDDKHADLRKNLRETYRIASLKEGQRRLELVENPPMIQVLTPGFTVRELPISLNNINNVRTRPDGNLLALAYDGDLFLLKDTDGDGLEDKAIKWWDNRGRLRAAVGLALTPKNFPAGNGAIVTSKGKVSAIIDSDGDDIADKEVVLATGWKELPHGVDAVGTAVDPKDGSVYFGMGTEAFTNPHLLDEKGKARYSVTDVYSTVTRIAPDLKTRAPVCTGVRFTVGLAFNKDGELFASDQEGATWLANGNPFDELLHIQTGKHYGFPPRHPKHLPNVVDEPSVVDFSPQHQSTCGLMFNGIDGKSFGPESWSDSAFVCGYSRGKIYRTRLARTGDTYVGQDEIIACMAMLPPDTCVASNGDLVVCAHGGGPDWGSGPTGKGKLFRISWSQPNEARPVAIWPAGPNETAIAFDRPLSDTDVNNLRQATIEAGLYVRAGDRFEKYWPGYQVVHMQRQAPRWDVPVRGVTLTPDRKTAFIATNRQAVMQRYAVTWPREKTEHDRKTLPQHHFNDLDYTPNGVWAEWKPKSGPAWAGWLPHLDYRVAKQFTADSPYHERLWKSIFEEAGTLHVHSKLDAKDFLRPAVQPGSKLDYELPPEKVDLLVAEPGLISLSVDGKVVPNEAGKTGQATAMNLPTDRLVDVELAWSTPLKHEAALDIRVRSSDDPQGRLRPIPPRRLWMPWAEKPSADSLVSPNSEVPEIAGGSWGRGRRVFVSEPANCIKCHQLDGSGAKIGPDLANLRHRDYTSVLRDITQPNFTLNPDHLTYNVILDDGRTLVGMVRKDGDFLKVGDDKGVLQRIPSDEVERIIPTGKSIMPEGLAKTIGDDRMKDLMTYLLTPPPLMPKDYPGKRPKLRTRGELDAVLKGANPSPAKSRKLKIVLVAGPKDHGPGEHDYPAWQKRWVEMFRATENVDVETAWQDPSEEQVQTGDVFIYFQRGFWSAARARAMDSILARGGGLVFLHWAVAGDPDVNAFAERIGLAAGGPKGIGFRHGPLDLTFEPKHPITRNLSKVHFHDESYWNMTGDHKRLTVLGTGVEAGKTWPLFWTREVQNGRVFVSILGHYSWTMDDPMFRLIMLRGVAWSAKEDVDRFNDLVTLGAEWEGVGSGTPAVAEKK